MSTPQYESDLNKIVLYDRESQKWNVVTSKWDRSVGSLIWSPNSDAFYCTAEEHGHVKIFSVNVKNGHVKYVFDKHMSSGLNYVVGNALDGEDEILFTMSSSMQPNELYSIPISPVSQGHSRIDTMKKPKQRTSFNHEALSKVLLSEPESFAFKGYKDVNVSGWIFKPPSFNPSSTYPVGESF